MSAFAERLARLVGVLAAIALIVIFFLPWVAPRGLLEALPPLSGFDLFKVRLDAGHELMGMMERARQEGGFLIGQIVDPMERALANPRYQGPMTALLAIGLIPLFGLFTLVFMALRWPWEWPLMIVGTVVVGGYVGARVWIGSQAVGPMIEANAGFGAGATGGALAGAAGLVAGIAQVVIRGRRRKADRRSRA
ncbi:MAG: hypothetical protein RLO50_16635 [Azospirillaceae bacterium]